MHTSIDVKRRLWLAGVLMPPLAGAWATPDRNRAEVWKDASCGCCKDPYDVLLVQRDGSASA